ncbi:MAG: VOC family protein [Pseudomonadota bacterium]
MGQATLEHANFTASDPDGFAAILCDLFGWEVRWAGSAMETGRTVHVGGPASYLAIYSPAGTPEAGPDTYVTRGGLNHIGVVVDDLDAVEEKVAAAGFTPKSHGDYEPGRRFYFEGPEGIEFEVISYA